MRQAFNISMRKSITGVHIALSGDFTHEDSDGFSALIDEVTADDVRIFLDVRKLLPMSEGCSDIFKTCYAQIPSRNVIFKGYHSTQLEQIEKLGHQGNRILFLKESCKCNGACKSCACQNRAKNRDERFDFMKEKLAAV